MWPRVVEILLGCWLAMSPFIFGYADDRADLWGLAFGSSIAIVTLAALSFWPPLRRIHLLELAVGAILVGSSFLLTSDPPSPPIQNHVILGILVMMVTIVPPDAAQPPPGWENGTARRRQ